MDNLENTCGQVTADAAEAEKQLAASGLGKFKDVKTLIEAYTGLEAEFTRRSQRLKELEERNKERALPDGDKAAPSAPKENNTAVDDTVRDAIIAEYLKSVAVNKAAPVILGGAPVSAPASGPKTVKEAGKLASEFFGN